jgi:hypothetical protein
MITVAATVIIGAIAGPDLIKRMPTFEGARAILPKWIRLEERLTPQQMVEQINAFCHDLNTLADASAYSGRCGPVIPLDVGH